MKRFIIKFIVALTLVVSAASHAGNNLWIHYNPESDSLSFVANDLSLLELLNHIADESGIEIKASQPVDRIVSGDFQDLSVEDVIDKLSQTYNLNVIKVFDEPNVGSKILIKVTFLRSGKESTLLATPRRGTESDTLKFGALTLRDKNKLERQSFVRDERWRARTDALPDHLKVQYERYHKKQSEKSDARAIRRLQKKTERDAKRKVRMETRKEIIKAVTNHPPKDAPPALRNSE